MNSINRKDWYQLRDDRIKNLSDESSKDFQDFDIHVVIDKSSIDQISTQLTTLCFINVASRWCRNITICVPDIKLRVPLYRGQDLREVISTSMREIDPYGQFRFSESPNNANSPIVYIGKKRPEGLSEPYFWLAGNNWIGGYGYGSFTSIETIVSDSANICGPSLAANLCNAALFKYAYSHYSPDIFSAWYSLFNYEININTPEDLMNPPCPTDVDLGNIHLVGCGAVGSSLVYLLTLMNTVSNINLIDFDEIDYSNCSNSMLFASNDALEKIKKVTACSNLLSSSSNNALPFDGDYHEFIEQGLYEEYPPDLILCLANERNIWSTIQANYPPLVFHATTNSSWGINYGRHIPFKEWCLLCRFRGLLETDFTPECGTSFIAKNSKVETLATLPFLSPTSSVVLLAELLKLSLGKMEMDYNYIGFSLKPTGSAQFQLLPEKPKADCPYCRDKEYSNYSELNKGSKYWAFIFD
ncbi:MAG: ThiF family adenylyltransferase [Bacteroidetes bacterium]|nr:ThiF family adenylyltransferase [Bacteroidota bacterium]